MRSQRFLIPIRLCAAAAEDLGRSLDQGLLPSMNLRGMNFKPGGQLGNGLFSTERDQRHLGLESRTVLLPAPLFPSFYERDSLLATCPTYWVHLRPSHQLSYHHSREDFIYRRIHSSLLRIMKPPVSL